MRPFQFIAVCLGVLGVLCGQPLRAQNEPPPFNPPGAPNRNRPGPWENDVLLFRTGAGIKVQKLATFPRAGVPTVARLKDGRLAAAFQHFPEDDNRNFDRVAVRFSSDDGGTWTDAEPIVVEGMDEGLARPFDPTLVPLPDGRVRLYFTSNRSADFRRSTPSIYSAISTNAIHYAFEPGVRFAVEDRIVIDCAVALHEGVFHLIVPDNGTADELRDGPQRGERPRGGTGYHATSKDGLNFTRQPDVQIDGARRWLGNAQSDGGVIRFFGTGGPAGVWTATSANGQSWKVDDEFPSVPGADPGAVKLKDGGWLLAVTGPPREGRRPAGQIGQGPGQRFPGSPVMSALDANGDGVIDEWELENATALLKKLDRNGDGRLTPDELRPTQREGGGAPGGPAPRRPRQPVE